MDALITGLMKSGAPWGILCSVLLALVVALWKRTVTLSDKLYDLGMKQIESTSHFREEMRQVQRELDELRRKP
jgi:ligand-binding sensor domain-containing protein